MYNGRFSDNNMIFRGLELIIFIVSWRLSKFDFFFNQVDFLFNYWRNHALVINCFFVGSNERIRGFMFFTFTPNFFILLFRNPIVHVLKIWQPTLLRLISSCLNLQFGNFLVFLNTSISFLFQFTMLNA